MKLNIANPTTGCMKCIEIENEKQLIAFYGQRIAQEVDGEILGEEFKGYRFRISGGNDKQGFPMMQGVLKDERVRLLMSDGMCHYRARRKGTRKRKSVRGCIVGSDIAVLNLTVVEKGAADIPGLTDAASARPRRLGPKRANHIRKLFNLTDEDDVKKYVIGRVLERKGKSKTKRPSIQRIVTPARRYRKVKFLQEKADARASAKAAAAAYDALLKARADERRESMAKRRSSRRSSKKADGATA